MNEVYIGWRTKRVWSGADQFMPIANLQRDRPVAAKFLVGPAKNPQRQAEDDCSESDGPNAGRMIGGFRDAGRDVEARQNRETKESRCEPDGFGTRAAASYNSHALRPALERDTESRTNQRCRSPR